MKVPYTIPVNTLRAYAASDQTLMLMGERFRQIRAEDILWDERVPESLAHICLQTLANNFAEHYEVLSFLPQFDLDHLLVILAPDLPLDLVAPIITDGIYWKRRCEFRWQKQPLDIFKHSNSWKIMYIEKHVQEYIHYQEPGYIDWKDVNKVMNVCSPFLFRLVIKELKPPRKLLPEPIPPDECSRDEIMPDHMDLSKVIKYLHNLIELSIRFGVQNIGMKYNPNFFKVSLNDINNLSIGLKDAPSLSILRLHRCNIDDAKVNIVLNALKESQTLQLLEISHCKFGDIGAKAIGHFMLIQPNLKTLLIPNNLIRGDGAFGLAYALKKDECCSLKTLDLQFNLINDQGAMCLATAIAVNKTLQELNLGGAGIKSEGAKKIAESLLFSNSIQKIELCNNHFGESVGDLFISAAQNNKKLYTLDIRNCGLGTEAETNIHKYISRNRQIYRSA